MKFPVFAVLPLLAACAHDDSNVPSLAPRAVEAGSFDEPARTAARARPDAALDAAVADRSAAFAAALRQYRAVSDDAARRIVAGARAPRGSDAWLAGGAAAGEVGQARAGVSAALAGIEALAITRAAGNLPPYPALEAVLASAREREAALP